MDRDPWLTKQSGFVIPERRTQPDLARSALGANHPRLDIFEPIAPSPRMAEHGQRDRFEDRQPLATEAVGAEPVFCAADVGERIEAA